MKTFKKSMAIILSILMLVSVMAVAGMSASAADEEAAYFIKHPWGGGATPEWTWQAMTAAEDGTFTYTGVWGNNGCNINTADSDEGAKWYPVASINGGSALAEGDEVTLVYDPATAELGVLGAEKEPEKVITYALHGCFTGDWASTDLTEAEGVWTAVIDVTDEDASFGLKKNGNGEQLAWYAAGEKVTVEDTTTITLVDTNTKNIAIAAGKYSFAFNPETMELAITKVVEEDKPADTSEPASDTEPQESSETPADTSEPASETEPQESSETPADTSEPASETEPQESSETPADTSEPASETEPQESSETPADTSEPASDSQPQESSETPADTSEPASDSQPAESTEPVSETEKPTLPSEGIFHVVAGVPELCNGAAWKPGSALNLMELVDGIYTITYTNVPAGSYEFKVTTGGDWDIGDFNFVGDAKFGGPNCQITVEEDGATVVINFKEDNQRANCYINGVLAGGAEFVEITTAETEPTTEEITPTTGETEPTTAAPCDHAKTTTKNKKAATYFAKGYTGDKVCAACGKVISKGKATAIKKLAKPTGLKVTAGKKKVTVSFKKVKDAKGYQVYYKIGKKAKTITLNAKTLKKVIKAASKAKVTVKVRAYVKSGKTTKYSAYTAAKSVKAK